MHEIDLDLYQLIHENEIFVQHLALLLEAQAVCVCIFHVTMHYTFDEVCNLYHI